MLDGMDVAQWAAEDRGLIEAAGRDGKPAQIVAEYPIILYPDFYNESGQDGVFEANMTVNDALALHPAARWGVPSKFPATTAIKIRR